MPETKFGVSTGNQQSPQDTTPPDTNVCGTDATTSEINIQPAVDFGLATVNGVVCEALIMDGESLTNAVGNGQQLIQVDLAGVTEAINGINETSLYTSGMQGHIARLNGPCAATTTSKVALCAGSNALDTRNWAMEFTDSNILDCNTPTEETTGCHPGEVSSCAVGGYKASVDVPPTSLCGDLDPMQLQFHVAQNIQSATTNSSDCTSGSGRFYLLPSMGADNDKDGKLHGTYYPVQVSGTGVLTPKAWITSVTPVGLPTNVGMKAIKTAGNWFFTWSDMVQNASEIAVTINGTTSIASGILHGGTLFAIEEIALADVSTLQADMSWTCSRNAPIVSRPQGYQLRLSDIGCPINQKLTLRYATSPKRVYIEPYGSPDRAVIEPTVTTATGQAFVFEQRGLMLDATLLSTNATQAVVRIDDIRWNNQQICTPGTYTLVEE